jgi:two-component system, NtrC family, sensor kinase
MHFAIARFLPSSRVRLRKLFAGSNLSLAGLLTLSLLLPAALFAALAWQERASRLREGEQTAIRTASSIAEHAVRVLETHSLALEQVDLQIRDRPWAEIEKDERLRHNLNQMAEKFPQIRSIWLVDADGALRQFGIAAGKPVPQLGTSVAHLDYFQAHRTGTDGRLFISSPFDGRSGGPGARQFTVSVKRSQASGTFDGVISVAVSLDFFTDFWRQVTPAIDHVVPLLKSDGTLLVRHPAGNHPPRLDPKGPFMQQVTRAPGGGFYTAVSRVDGIERMNAYLPVGQHPLYVSFSMEKAKWLAPWRMRALMYATLALVTTLALASMALLALRQVRAQREAARQALLSARRAKAEVRRRERLEAQLIQAQKMEAVGQLTGGVAHDFNNLLHTMSLNVHMAERAASPEQVSKCLVNIRRSVDRAAQLTRQLTAFSRRQRLEPRSFEPVGLIVRMADMLSRTLGGHIQFEIDAPPDLFNVYADPGQTELALLNLAVNARDAMPEGGRLVFRMTNVELAQGGELREGPYVQISVTDTGCGIPPELIDRVFEPFFTTKEIGKGTGLGLSMVHGFARQSGGSVSVTSRLGQGTTVSLLLPRGEQQAEVADHAAASPGAASRLGGRVLLVDDDSLVRASMLVMLQEVGYDVDEAPNAAAALEALRNSRPDVLVTDFAMPGMNGLALAQLARSMHPGLPVILVTGYAEHTGSQRTSDHIDARLHKPFTAQALVSEIDALLQPRVAVPGAQLAAGDVAQSATGQALSG